MYDKNLIQETHELVKENNKLLKKMRRASIIGTIFKILFWAIILGVPIALYYFVAQPYIEGLTGAYQELKDGAESLQEVREQIPDVLIQFLRFIGISVE